MIISIRDMVSVASSGAVSGSFQFSLGFEGSAYGGIHRVLASATQPISAAEFVALLLRPVSDRQESYSVDLSDASVRFVARYTNGAARTPAPKTSCTLHSYSAGMQRILR